jgi:hypothetical protein
VDLAERNRLIAVTKGFQPLRGLIYVPAGLLNVALSVANSSGYHPHHSVAEVLGFLALFPCAIAATFAAWWYYRRRFGVVRSKCRGGRSVLLLTVGTMVAIVTLVGAMYVDDTFYEHPAASYPVSLTCLWWAILYVSFYLAPYGVRPHSLWFAALFFGLCFLTLVGVAPKSQFFMGSGRAGDIVIWLAFSVHGLLDHLLLLRLLPKASQEQAAAQSAAQSGKQHD